MDSASGDSMDTDLSQVLDDHFLDGHETFDADRLRTLRQRCQRIETSLSYLRRLAQGRIDIVTAELDRRAKGGDPFDLDDLVSRLPEVLSDRTRSAQVGPMPQVLAPGRVEGALADELAGMEFDAHLSELPDVSTEWLESTRESLVAYEQRVSKLRRALFDRIDTLGVELGRRYRDGDADIDSIIGEPRRERA
ncbi:MAG TPA: hypothetical protein VFN21_08235 [Acidimicrobiales bacterium]|nr:hypothetical protein [Acidimicrobiales bacterium]